MPTNQITILEESRVRSSAVETIITVNGHVVDTRERKKFNSLSFVKGNLKQSVVVILEMVVIWLTVGITIAFID